MYFNSKTLKGSMLCLLSFALFTSAGEKKNYLSPGAIAVNEKQSVVFTVLTTDKAVAITYPDSKQTPERIELKQNPNDILISPDGSTLFVSCGESRGTIEIISLPEKKIKTSVNVGHSPQSMVLSADGKLLYVANRFNNNVSVIDLNKKKEIITIPAQREPRALCITPDGKTLAVANFLPHQPATDTVVAAQITLVDLSTNTVSSNVTLENGAQSVSGITSSPDGKYIYAIHILSRFTVPVTQLDRGWVNTNALSIIDLKSKSVYATLLLDDVDNGASNPSSICVGEDKKLYIALSGTHELMSLDYEPMQQKIEALYKGEITDAYIHNEKDLSTSLSFTAPFKKRIALQGRSPRGLSFYKGSVLVSCRFSSSIEKIPVSGNQTTVILPLGDEPASDAIRRGELAFYDASICYQQWQSCASCHPDGRVDGLNWDQQNDGLGNPKNTKSLLFSHVTPPSMITGIRESAELAVRKGILHTLGTIQPEALACDIDEYLKNLTPVVSPYLSEYKKKDKKERGKKLFDECGCTQCHTGKYSTDQTKYNVGTGTDDDKDTFFDTPTLQEVWRTAPYLYDGKASTIYEVLTGNNPDDKHGTTQKLSKEDLDALVLYIYTL